MTAENGSIITGIHYGLKCVIGNQLFI